MRLFFCRLLLCVCASLAEGHCHPSPVCVAGCCRACSGLHPLRVFCRAALGPCEPWPFSSPPGGRVWGCLFGPSLSCSWEWAWVWAAAWPSSGSWAAPSRCFGLSASAHCRPFACASRRVCPVARCCRSRRVLARSCSCAFLWLVLSSHARAGPWPAPVCLSARPLSSACGGFFLALYARSGLVSCRDPCLGGGEPLCRCDFASFSWSFREGS